MISEEIEKEIVQRLNILEEALQGQLIAVNESINSVSEIQYLLLLKDKLSNIESKISSETFRKE